MSFTLGVFNGNSLVKKTAKGFSANTHELNFSNFLQSSDLNYEFKEYSWLKGMRDVQRDPDLLLFGVSRTKEREDKLTWVLPLYDLQFSLYGINSPDKSHWTIENLYEGNLVVACHSQSNACEYLRKNNIPEAGIFEFVSSSPTQQLDLLEGGRVDFVFLSQYEMQNKTRAANVPFENYSKSDLVNTSFTEYLVGHKNINPALVTKIKSAAKRLGYGLE